MSLSVENWIDIGTLTATVIIAATALYQLKNQRRMNKVQRTMDAVREYDTSPVIAEAERNIWEQSNHRLNYDSVDEFDKLTLLNYLESLAIGIEQGVYDSAIVNDHLGSIIQAAIEKFINIDQVPKEEFPALMKLYNRWFPVDYETKFKA